MPVNSQIAQDRIARHRKRQDAAQAVVPVGPYCYAPAETRYAEDGMPILGITPCPYWKARGDWREKGYGYCRLLKAGDSSPGRDRTGRPIRTMLLWDQVKECGINPGSEADDRPDV